MQHVTTCGEQQTLVVARDSCRRLPERLEGLSGRHCARGGRAGISRATQRHRPACGRPGLAGRTPRTRAQRDRRRRAAAGFILRLRSDDVLNENWGPIQSRGRSVAEWLACWTQRRRARVQIATATLSGSSLRQIQKLFYFLFFKQFMMFSTIYLTV